MKKILTVAISATALFSVYVVWLKKSATCLGCGKAYTGLPVSQLTLAILALAGSLIIGISYYLSQRIRGFQYVSLAVSGVSAAIASFLMTVQIERAICWPCLTTDILFYLIFLLVCLDVLYKIKGKINSGGIMND